MKKKYPVTYKDKKDWITFTKRLENIYDKDAVLIKQDIAANKTRRLDLHGLSLNQANKIVKEFIIDKNYVTTNLGELVKDTDLSKFIL